MDKTHKLILSGFGGQGLMFLGKLIAQAAVKEGRFITWFPCYGAEVRGGTAHCAVIISNKEIASPLVSEPDIVLAMNQPSLNKFAPKVVKGGMIFVNETLVNKIPKINGAEVIKGPFTKIASELGEVRIANMVALGSIIEKTKMVGLDNVLSILDEMVPASRKYIMETNRKAIEEGRKLVMVEVEPRTSIAKESR